MKKVILTLAAFALASHSAFAQQTTPTKPTPAKPTIEEKVEVVATRLPLAPHDVPASVEVFTGTTLRLLGATNLREALSLATGVEVAPGGDSGPAGAVPEFWGLREFDAFLLVVDDIPWGGAFNPALTSLNMRDVERVEVVRGSAPVTYGAASFVGVIHVVHKASSATTRYLDVRGGQYGTGGASIDFSLPALGTWTSRLTIDGERQGFKDARTSYSRAHGFYRGGTMSATSRTWVLADVNLLQQNPSSPHPRQGTQLSSLVPLDANYNPADARLDEARVAFSFGHNRQIMSNAQWSVNASYTHSGQDQFRGFLTDISESANNATGFVETIDVNDIYVDTHLAWPTGKKMQFVAGGDFLFANGEGKGATFNYTVPLSGASASSVTEPSTLNLDSEARRSFFGGYALAEFTPNSRVRISTGLRLNATVERRGEGESVTNTRPAGSVGVLLTAWERGTDHVKFFGNYRNTFKPAAFDFSLAENEGVLKPETAASYEGGVKVRGAQGRFDLEASMFRMDFENLVTSTVVNGLPALINAGTTRFQGFESAIDVRVMTGVQARGTYAYHDGKFVNFERSFDGVVTQLAGKRFEMSANHLATAGLIVAPAGEDGVVGSFTLKYTGDRFMDKRNRALAPSFVTADLGLGYRFNHKYELRLDARNLGDARDVVSESELGDAQYYRMTARRIEFSLGVRF